jgi:type VI secretion system protein ImpL
MSPSYLLTGSALAAYLLLEWLLGPRVLGLHGSDVWVFRVGMAVVGILVAGLYMWYHFKSLSGGLKLRKSSAKDAPAEGTDEVDLLARDAEARLAASKLGRGARLSQLPAIFVVGPTGSSKTTVLVHSGLEPELLAGQVYQENNIVPTRSVNLWFARQTIFVEAAGKLLADQGQWAKLVRRMAPGKLQAVGQREQAPRAAVVCFDCEEFLKPGAADSLAVSVRALHQRLGEVSQLLGISFPVYVLFSKLDRLPFFLDYVRNLSQAEAAQVLGATLPIQTGQSEGVYAEQATQQLSAAFNTLYYSLCNRRIDFLAREHAPDKLPGAYEFPREFRKLRNSLVQFLVDLSKPSQLRAAPFLRGFYFSGVRPVVVEELAPAAPAARAPQQPGQAPSTATGIFRSGQAAPAQPLPAAPQVRGTRRVPQWLFLSHFFHDILLEDRSALGASSSSVKANLLRRVLLATAAGLCLLVSIGFLVSYVRNRSLETRVLEAARGIRAVEPGGQALPSLDSLKRLDTLRQVLVTLTEYEREGPPLSLRWWLYTGSDLYPDVRRTYFNRAFHPVVFGWTQAALLESLRRLPGSPGPNDQYRPVYDALKAYLITTSEYKRSTREFLSPVLLNRWAEGRNVDAERTGLARNQFDFYSEELKTANPFSTENDTLTVERARRYLKSFNAEERIYQGLVDAASRKFPPVRMFPNEVVLDPKEVRGAFTKDGWSFMQTTFKKPVFEGEEWVLGPQVFAAQDQAQLEQKLRAFYYRDFIKEWREFVKAASVSKYNDLQDAANKLGILSGGQSPLLGLLCLVSQNTNVDIPEVKNAFDAPQRVVPATCQNQYVGPTNQNYMGSLLGLQSLVAQVAASPAGLNDPAAGQTASKANEALLLTGQMAQSFQIDREANLPAAVRTLIEEPITQVRRLLLGLGPQELKNRAGGMCNQFRELMAKYPFNPKSTVQASVEDVNRFFRPQDGALWQFYSQSLQKLLQQQGTQFVAQTGGTMTVTPAFLNFFNRAAAFALAAYPGGAQQPKLNYTLKANLAGTNQSITLTLDGQTFNIAAGQAAAKQFAWPGNPPGANMTVKFGNEGFNWPRYEGLWAAFEFFADSEERAQPSGSVYPLEWRLRTGQAQRPVTTAAGQPVAVRFDLDMMGAPPIFRKGYFSGWSCVVDVAK